MSPYRAPYRPRGPSLADAPPVPWWRPFRRYRGIQVLQRLTRRQEDANVVANLSRMRDWQIRDAAATWGREGHRWFKFAHREGVKRGFWDPPERIRPEAIGVDAKQVAAALDAMMGDVVEGNTDG